MFSVLNKKKTRTTPLAESSQKIILFDYIVSIPRAARMCKGVTYIFCGFPVSCIVLSYEIPTCMRPRSLLRNKFSHSEHRIGTLSRYFLTLFRINAIIYSTKIRRCYFMAMMSAKEASSVWGISPRRVTLLCSIDKGCFASVRITIHHAEQWEQFRIVVVP